MNRYDKFFISQCYCGKGSVMGWRNGLHERGMFTSRAFACSSTTQLKWHSPDLTFTLALDENKTPFSLYYIHVLVAP